MPKQHIPVHTLNDINKVGIEIRRIGDLNEIDEDLFGAHRDDHYLFFFQQGGSSKVMVDFKELRSSGSTLFFILPGQVHQVIGTINSSGWFMALAPSYINQNYRMVFEELIINQQPIPPNTEIAKQLDQTLLLLNQICNENASFKFQEQVIRSLIDTSMGFYASAYLTAESAQNNQLRPAIITREFRILLRKKYKEIKSPTAYANLLNISTTYLNEAVKQNTGFPVSYWIHQEVTMEAKRLLYYTNNSIKEIAHELGYMDHAYFSRLFHKAVGQSPIQFRNNYRE